jgi:Uma2 family endonuclease
VYLDENNAFQPDIIFILKENLSIVKEGRVRGTPDLIVEVLSSGTKNLDLGKKKLAYEKNRVKEYFVVYPETKSVIGFYLVDGKYQQQQKAKGKIVSKLLNNTLRF